MLASLSQRRGLSLFLLVAIPALLFAGLYWQELKLLAGPVMIVLGVGAVVTSFVPTWVGADASTGIAPPFSALTVGLLVGGGLLALLGLPVSLLLLAAPPPPDQAAHAAQALLCPGISFGLVFGSLLIVLPRFVLPTQTRAERRRVTGRLLLYLLGQHGPAVLVRNGQLVASPKETDASEAIKPGLALVDPVSAIALERKFPVQPPADPQHWREGLAAELYRLERRLSRRAGLGEVLAALLYWGRWLRLVPPRAGHQWLLARRLIRPRPPKPPRLARVEGPGIVFIEADEMVRGPLDLRTQLRVRPNVKALTRDGIEVTATLDVFFKLKEPEAASAADRAEAVERNRPAFVFNCDSAFLAVYGSPVAGRKAEAGEGEVKQWTDLPTFVASDIFRDLILTRALDDLFHPTTDDVFPLAELRASFSERVQNDRVLGERGIRVVSADFGKLSVPARVEAQRLTSWKADWIRQSVETLAGGDLERLRIIERARANAQYDLVTQMSAVLKETGSNAAVLLRFIQALERASSEPNTRRLLPDETIRLLNSWIKRLSRWLPPSGAPAELKESDLQKALGGGESAEPSDLSDDEAPDA